MKIVRPTLEHFRAIKVRAYEIEDLGENLDDADIDHFLSSYGHTLLDEKGEVVMILGGKAENKLCHTWLIASSLLYSYPVTSMRLILRTLKELQVRYDVKIFFTYNLPHHERELRFLESIGYVRDGLTDEFPDKKERILLIKRTE